MKNKKDKKGEDKMRNTMSKIWISLVVVLTMFIGLGAKGGCQMEKEYDTHDHLGHTI